MNVYDQLFTHFENIAQNLTIDKLVIGIAYTGVILSNGSSGLSYTWIENTESAHELNNFNPEGQTALETLKFIKDKNPLKKTIALATINALNHEYCSSLPDDDKNNGLFAQFQISDQTKISMIGFIKPLYAKIKKTGAVIQCIDLNKQIGNQKIFYSELKNADILIITSTSLLNASLQQIMKIKPPQTKTVLIGPTTPVCGDIFKNFGIDILAGSHTILENNDKILQAVAHGKGTLELKQYLRKIILKI